MKKRKLAALFIALVLIATSLCGCSSSGSASATPTAAASTAEATAPESTDYADSINIYIWSDYVADDVFSGFEEKYGIHVNQTWFDSMDELRSKMLSGAGESYDLIMAGYGVIAPLIEAGVLQKLDFDNIPNFEYISDAYKKQAYDPNDEYTVPYLDSYHYIVYNKTVWPDGISSFADLADSKYEGQIVSMTNMRSMMGIALESLGYDINTTDESEISAAADLWKTIKPNVKVFMAESPRTPLLNGECSVGILYSGDAAIAMQEMPDTFAVADIGTPIVHSGSNWAVPTGAAHKTEAELFINYICEPEVMANNLDYYPYICPNTEAVKLASDSYKENPAYNSDVIDKISKTAVLAEDVGSATEIYEKYWNEVIATD